ncbi:hypothetical protein SFRURICE_011650 [Spodoptera frugiperda]|nr:hypothetical protein SFRURICE_011650 [Spodoptera frugiperda]
MSATIKFLSVFYLCVVLGAVFANHNAVDSNTMTYRVDVADVANIEKIVIHLLSADNKMMGQAGNNVHGNNGQHNKRAKRELAKDIENDTTYSSTESKNVPGIWQ